MKMIFIHLILVVTLLPLTAFSSSETPFKSSYTGQEKRDIKSLSESDIEELRNGRGWGLAKAAELNGVPGPVHLLEMQEELSLSQVQTEQIKTLYQEMQQQAVPLGIKLIEFENELNTQFAERTINEKSLRGLLEEIGQTKAQLRYVHLSAHLKTPHILTDEQIDLYNKLRGYFSDDPCKNIPEGHDPEMWKRHNNCP